MAKRADSISSLALRLQKLDTQREQAARQLQQALADIVGTPAPRSSRTRRVGGRRRRRGGGRPKGFKVSAATKAKLKAAWKKRKAAATKV